MQNSKHFRALEDIAENPEKIGIESPVKDVFIERRFFRDGALYVEPDILFYLESGVYIPVEYKSNSRHKDKARIQLLRSQEVVIEQLGCVDPVLVYSYGKEPYSVQQLITLSGREIWHTVQ